MAKRDIFFQLIEGAAAMKTHREGNITLHSYKVEVAPLPKVDSELIRTRGKNCAAREQCSRATRGSTKERWRNGNRGGRSRIPRRRPWCYWCGGIRIHWRGWTK